MRPQKIGRVLGVGLRVAGRMAGQRLAGPDHAAGAGRAAASTVQGAAASRASGRQAGRATGSVARGLGGFFRPFRRVGGMIFLEVTGVFFLLFVLVFGTWAWRVRADYAKGPEHVRFLVYAGMMVVFLYLSVSSFWRARRK